MPDTVLRISLADVQRLSFECRACGAIAAIAQKETWKAVRPVCPLCHAEWPGEVAIARALQGLASLTASDLPFILRLELPSPAA